MQLPAGPPETSWFDALIDVLIDALAGLESAGQAENASRLAGRAYAALRREHPDHAERINALMHHLTRNLDPVDGRGRSSGGSAPDGVESR